MPSAGRCAQRNRRRLKLLLERQGNKCGICQEPIRSGEEADLDHIVPKSRGGKHTLSNLQATHKACNGAKGNRMPCNCPCACQALDIHRPCWDCREGRHRRTP